MGQKWALQIRHFGHLIWIIGRYHEVVYPFEGWYQLRNLFEHHFPFEPRYETNLYVEIRAHNYDSLKTKTTQSNLLDPEGAKQRLQRGKL